MKRLFGGVFFPRKYSAVHNMSQICSDRIKPRSNSLTRVSLIGNWREKNSLFHTKLLKYPCDIWFDYQSLLHKALPLGKIKSPEVVKIVDMPHVTEHKTDINKVSN